MIRRFFRKRYVEPDDLSNSTASSDSNKLIITNEDSFSFLEETIVVDEINLVTDDEEIIDVGVEGENTDSSTSSRLVIDEEGRSTDSDSSNNVVVRRILNLEDRPDILEQIAKAKLDASNFRLVEDISSASSSNSSKQAIVDEESFDERVTLMTLEDSADEDNVNEEIVNKDNVNESNVNREHVNEKNVNENVPTSNLAVPVQDVPLDLSPSRKRSLKRKSKSPVTTLMQTSSDEGENKTFFDSKKASTKTVSNQDDIQSTAGHSQDQLVIIDVDENESSSPYQLDKFLILHPKASTSNTQRDDDEQMDEENYSNEGDTEATNEEVPNEEATNEELANDEATNEEITNEEATNEHVSPVDISNNELTINDSNSNNTATNNENKVGVIRVQPRRPAPPPPLPAPALVILQEIPQNFIYLLEDNMYRRIFPNHRIRVFVQKPYIDCLVKRLTHIYFCLCNKFFFYEHDIQFHLYYVHSPHKRTEILCEYCLVWFDQIAAFEQHVCKPNYIGYESGRGPWLCDLLVDFECLGHVEGNRTFYSRRRNRYFCLACRESFADYYECASHNENLCKNMVYNCRFCPRKFCARFMHSLHEESHRVEPRYMFDLQTLLQRR